MKYSNGIRYTFLIIRSYHIEILYKLSGIIMIRGKMATSLDIAERDYRDFDFSVGPGMRYSWFGVDYAMPIASSHFGLTHKISIIGKFPSPF